MDLRGALFGFASSLVSYSIVAPDGRLQGSECLRVADEFLARHTFEEQER